MRCEGGYWAFAAFESFSSLFFYLDVSKLFIGCAGSALRVPEMMDTHFASTINILSPYIDHNKRIMARTMNAATCLASCGFMTITYAID